MIWFSISRALQAAFVLLVIASLAFLLGAYVGDPLSALLPMDATNAQRRDLIEMLHLDKSIPERFWLFLGDAANGNFGISYRTQEPVVGALMDRLPATIELALISLVIALVLGILFGIYCALHPETVTAKLLMLGSILGVTLPNFVVGIFLILVFSVNLGWFNSFGRGETVQLGDWWTTGLLTHSGRRALVLPAITLSLFQITFIMRMVRAQMLEVMQADYIRFAAARGIPERSIHYVHALKNTLIPVSTIVGLQLGNIIAFAVVTEAVFSWPGLGSLFLESIAAADMPVISIYLVLIGAVYIIINLLVELTYPLIDPRVLK